MKAIHGESGSPKVVDTGFLWADKTTIDTRTSRPFSR